MPENESTAYDAVTYPGSALPQTHPDRLATIASLHGLACAPPERCRVLELGCGNGGNLIPMAYVLPGSTFLGIDAAGSAVAAGQAQIEALGLTNVALRHADLLQATSLGEYDYVIAHGLYSWVPPAVQERVLAIASEVLAPGGVAYVSYNALPGCHVRNAMRQMMRWHARDVGEPAEKIRRARDLVRFLSGAAPPRPVYSAILKETLEHQEQQQDAVLFHDDLAEANEPLLFIDFVERAGRHRLKFLSEADYCDMAVWDPDSSAGRFLLEAGAESIVLQQQYRDFLTFRRFRQTLLCREEAPLRRESDPEVVRLLRVGAQAHPKTPDPDVASDEPVCFVAEREREVTTSHQLSKAALLELGEIWPRWIPVPDLLVAARARVSAAGGPPATAGDETRVLRFLLACYLAEVSQLRSSMCPFLTAISERPRASALARLQSRTVDEVTSLSHASVRLEDPLVRKLLQLMDGTRDRREIERAMAAAIREAGSAQAALAADVEKGIALNLERVGRLALLEA